MSIAAMLAARKRLLGIDDNTVHNIRLVRPFLLEQLEPIVEQLYRHLLTFPECAKLLPEKAIRTLQTKQKTHWAMMFECSFSEAYAAHAMRIGQIHYDRKVPPYIYLAAYSYAQCLIVARIAEHAHGQHELAAILSSISRIVMLDIDLALLAYTRAFWTKSSGAGEGGDTLYL